MEVLWKTTHSARKKYQDYLKQVCKRTTTAISIFKLREGRFRLDKRKKKFYNEGGEAVGQVVW